MRSQSMSRVLVWSALILLAIPNLKNPMLISAFVSTPNFATFTSSTSLSSSSLQTQESLVSHPRPFVKRQYETYLWKPSNVDYFENDHPNQFKINYRVEGPTNGQPILLVHGFGANINHFRFNIPFLADRGYRVYAIDLLGFGASDKPKNAIYSIELWRDLLSDFIRDVSIGTDKKWVICGNSIGGLCSLATAVKEQTLINGCVLFNCAGAMTGFRYDELPIFLWPILWFVQNVVFGDVVGTFFFQNFKTRTNVESILNEQGVYVDKTNVDDELLEILLGPSEDDGAKEVFLRVFRGPPGPSPESLLPNLETPVLAIWGSEDPWTPHDGGLHPATNFDKYAKGPFQLILLNGVGHCPHDEAPDQVNTILMDFLANLSTPITSNK